MATKIVAFSIAWNTSDWGQRPYLRLKLEDDRQAELRVPTLQDLATVSEILRTTRPVFFDPDKNLIQSAPQKLD